uniref:CASC1 C-terminal domain-containing protein n=1 Tax=Stomoxys calcitrans TaxID=35570 RepID=A0A1I8PAQ3_STOCA
MPPKKSKKAKEPLGPPEKVYILLTMDEVKAQEHKHKKRLNDLKICLNFIEDAFRQIEEFNAQELVTNKWQDFLACNPLPKPYLPPDIRIFFTKLKFFEDQNMESNIDWPLAVNERSILAQNLLRKDLTRARLRGKIKPEFGWLYNENINYSLDVMRRIEYFLDNDVEVAKCPMSVLEDVKDRKVAIENEVREYFDRYTYRILGSEEAYMNSVDAISAEYCFSGDNFEIHIWSLKNVPIRFSHLDEPRLVANLHQLQILLHIPSTMLHENVAIRAIHMKFDHITEYAKSFSQAITVPVENLNAGIQDLPECLTNEWSMQCEIQEKVRHELMQKRQEYEVKLREYEEAQAKKGKKKSKDDSKASKKSKKEKTLKPPKEPPLIDGNTLPDVYDDFMDEEQKQYEDFINLIYNPEVLDLDSDEINLKKFLILGGIYQLYYVSKPPHVDFNYQGFNMTWHLHDSKLAIDKDMFIPATPSYLSRRSTRLMSMANLRRLSRMEQPKDSTDPECPWFVLTIKLREYLCHWGEPIACHFETVEKVIEEEKVQSIVAKEESKISKETKRQLSAFSLTLSTKDQTSRVSQANFHKIPPSPEKKSSLLKVAPRRLGASQRFSQGNFFQSSLSLRRSLGDARAFGKARSQDGTLNIRDFYLTPLLKKAQIRHLERHCMPRMISSFKFPIEIKEEQLEALQKRTKTKGGILVRKKMEDDQMEKEGFAYNEFQNSPERLFALYSTAEIIRVMEQIQDSEEDGLGDKENLPPKTFLDLIKLLNDIKKKYKMRIRSIYELKPFQSKMKWRNKRLKQFFKNYERKHLQTSVTKEKKSAQTKTEGRHVNMKSNIESVPTLTKARESGTDLKKIASKVQVVEATASEVQDFSLHDPNMESQLFENIETKKLKTTTYSHWTTKHILRSEFDKEKQSMVIQTDRLGYIGFACKRYEHFPFKYWSLEPSREVPDNEVIFTLETQYVRCVLYCTPHGIRGHVTEPTKKFVRNPKMYLVIKKPMKDYKEFKKLFKDNNLNIFAEHDAGFYIENGYFSEKHLATEMHTYCCMAIHSNQMKFNFSQWNRLAKRRDIIFKFIQKDDLPENLVEVRITPEEAFFVEISELCSDDLNVIKLDYALTWRNIGSYTDLHHLIRSMYTAAMELRCRNPKLISCIKDLLCEIRPLSFS